MSLQAVFPSPPRVAIPKEFNKKPPRLHKKIFNVLDDHTTDVEMIGDGAKIIRDSFAVASHVKGREIKPAITLHANALADTFECLEIFATIRTLVNISQKKARTSYKKKMHALKATSAVFSLAYGVMSGVKLVNEVILQNLGKGVLSYGKIPVFGLPFMTVFGLFDLVRTSIDAVVSSFKLHRLSKDLSHTSNKIKKVWKKPIDASFAKAKKNHLKEKQVLLLKGAHILCRAIEVSKKPKEYPHLKNDLAVLKKHFISREEKLAKWENLHLKLEAGTITQDQLEDFRTEKLQKWKIKKVNLKWRIGKEILSLVLSCVTILFLFTTIILSFTGIAALPAFMLASGIIGLSLSAGFFGKHLLIKYKNDKPYEKVEIPELV